MSGLRGLLGSEIEGSGVWSVFAHAVNTDVDKSNLKSTYSVLIPLGAFKTRGAAENHAKKLTEKHRNACITVSKYGSLVELKAVNDNMIVTSTANSKTLSKIDEEARLKEEEYYEMKQREYEDREKDLDLEESPTVERYRMLCLKAINAKSCYDRDLEKLEAMREKYDKYIKMAQDHYREHPEHEPLWLENLKALLLKRGEESAYGLVEKMYTTIRPEIVSETCEGDVCLVE